MENATKALLIAAAILIAILIISMGIVVYRNSAEQVNNANLSDVQITSYNSKFEQYSGTQSKADVKALAKLVLNNNLNNDNQIDFKFWKNSSWSDFLIKGSKTDSKNPTTSLPSNFDDRFTASTYQVGFSYDSTTGLIISINAK